MSIYGPQSTGNLRGTLRGYVGRLVAWVKRRVTGYGVAAALILVGIIFIGVSAGVGTAALFYWIELHYGPWTAYGVIGGCFGAIGIGALLAALILLKRRSPPLPAPPSVAQLFRQAALPMASRVASKADAGIGSHMDGTTRLLATAAAVLLVGWAVTSHATRSSRLEGDSE